MERHIVHLDIPDFYAAIEELRRPELRRRPVALAEPGPRAVIQGVNRNARSEGIREGMPLNQARRNCRRLLVLAPDLGFYREQHHTILQDLSRYSPLIEGTLWGHYFIDLTGTRRLWGPAPDIACRLEAQLEADRRLQARVGLAANKLVSQVAAHLITPGDLCDIFPGGETAFLAPLPVTALPGVGPVTSMRLTDFNIQKVGELAAFSARTLAAVFGRLGPRLLRLAQGIDPTPVVPFENVPRLNLARTLECDELPGERLEALLWQQVEEAGWLLRQHNRIPGQLAVEIRHADGVTGQHRLQLPPVTAHLDRRLFQAARTALERAVHRRVAIRRLALEFSAFSMPARQLPLFPWEETALERDQRLQQALDKIRQRFGREKIVWGRTLGK